MSALALALQEDVRARIAGDAFFASIPVLADQPKEIASEIDQRVKALGVCVVIAVPTLKAPRPNWPTPVFEEIAVRIRVLESAALRVATPGALEIAEKITAVLHRHTPASETGVEWLLLESDAIAPLKHERYLAYEVRLTTQKRGSYARVRFGGAWLTNDGETSIADWSHAEALECNGAQVVQAAQFLRAAFASNYARRNKSTRLRFTVTRRFSTAAEAAAVGATAFSHLPEFGDAELWCDAPGEPLTILRLENAVLENLEAKTAGATTSFTFTLRGGRLSGALGVAVPRIHGGELSTHYTYALGGTVDGGNPADRFVPAALTLDGGLLS